MAKKLCRATGCKEFRYGSRSLCNRHRYILKKYGQFTIPEGAKVLRPVLENEVNQWEKMYLEGLNTTEIGLVYGRHASVIHTHLKVKGVLRNRADVKVGELNPMWAGLNVGYGSLHSWVKRHKPKPDLCEICQTEKPRDLANISQEYHRDVNDFEWLCRRCHMVKDGRMNNLVQFARK